MALLLSTAEDDLVFCWTVGEHLNHHTSSILVAAFATPLTRAVPTHGRAAS